MAALNKTIYYTKYSISSIKNEAIVVTRFFRVRISYYPATPWDQFSSASGEVLLLP